MRTEKKNQHYLPKFYLRNFSFQNNKREIGMLNTKSGFYYPRAKLKTQASKNFYYGKDGIIEDRLSLIESDLSKLIQIIINTLEVPIRSSEDHTNLLLFIALTDLRNPVRIEGSKAMLEQVNDRILEMGGNTTDIFQTMTHEAHVHFTLSKVQMITKVLNDLFYKLIINKSRRPFIASNFPIVKYNQFLEKKKWPTSKTGYGLVGLQIFVPLSPTVLLAFYDSNIYKIGFNRQKTLIMEDERDVDNLNLLQFLNGSDTIFFDERANESYLQKLFDESKKFRKANEPQSSLNYLFFAGDDESKAVDKSERNLIRFNSTDCETKLTVKGIKIHSRGSTYKVPLTAGPLRPGIDFSPRSILPANDTRIC